MRGRYLVGVDVGTTKTCAVVARVDRNGMEVIASGTVPSSGIKKGVVVDIDETANSVKMAVREAESVSGVEIKAAYVGIAGSHVKGQESYGVTGIKGKEVRQKDIDRVVEAASSVCVPLDREIIHVLPAEFVLDGQDGITRPLGMSGMRLEARVQVITAAQSHMENLERALSRAGIKLARLVFQPVASAMAVLRADEREHGVLLVDFGGGTTDIALYKGGTLRYASVIPIGGLHLTNDISVGLKLPQNEAERLKRRYGTIAESPSDMISATSMSGEPLAVSLAELAAITRARCDELFELVKNEAAQASLKHAPLCAVITGGGSLLRNIAKIAERWLSLPVRTGAPERVKSPLLKDMVKEPQFATAIGLLHYGLLEEGGESGASLFSTLSLLPEFFESLGEKFSLQKISVNGKAGARRFLSKLHARSPQ